MIVFWIARAWERMTFILVSVILVIPVIGHSFLEPSGVVATFSGSVLAEVFVLSCFALGLMIRTRSRRKTLEVLTEQTSAEVSSSARLHASSFRWLITEVGNRTVRFAPPDLVNIAVTAAGFGIYWMHPSAPLNLIHTLRWADIADSSIQRRRWGREDLTLVLRNGQRTIRFRLIRPSPVSPSMAGVLAAAVHHRTH